jgi:HB1, ASXL, restriction endonuclease HTH domain
MDNFQRQLQFYQDVVDAISSVIKHYQKKTEDLSENSLKPVKRQRPPRKLDAPPEKTSKIDVVKKILQNADRPMHIGEILEIARTDFGETIRRGSIVSMLVKKFKAGEEFIRTAPNTFALKRANE